MYMQLSIVVLPFVLLLPLLLCEMFLYCTSLYIFPQKFIMVLNSLVLLQVILTVQVNNYYSRIPVGFVAVLESKCSVNAATYNP